MAVNLHEMTLLELKALARERIGRGISKLRTKETLIEALKKVDLTSSAQAVDDSSACLPAQTATPDVKAKASKSKPRASKVKEASPAQGELFGSVATSSAVDSMRALFAMYAPSSSSSVVASESKVDPPQKAPRADSKKDSGNNSDAVPRRPSKSAKAKQSAPKIAPVEPKTSAKDGKVAEASQKGVQQGGILSGLADATSSVAPTLRTRCSDPFFLNDAAEKTPAELGADQFPAEEALGELPDSYDEERLVLVSKGPYALYLYWDLKLATVSRLAKSDGVILCLRLFANQKMVREMECRLDDRSWYFYGLQPGLSYTVQLVTITNNGECHALCEPSNTVTLPSDLPSPHIDDKFVSISMDVKSGDVDVTLTPGILSSDHHLSDLKSADAPRAPFSLALREALYLASGGKFAHEIGSSEHFPTDITPAAHEGSSISGEKSGDRAHPWSGLLAGMNSDKNTSK